LKKATLEPGSGLTAESAIKEAFGIGIARRLTVELAANDPELTISWINRGTGEHSQVGGLDSLDWGLADDSILTVLYENGKTTEQQVDESTEWMLENER
jgi:hypothetical protein